MQIKLLLIFLIFLIYLNKAHNLHMRIRDLMKYVKYINLIIAFLKNGIKNRLCTKVSHFQGNKRCNDIVLYLMSHCVEMANFPCYLY